MAQEGGAHSTPKRPPLCVTASLAESKPNRKKDNRGGGRDKKLD